MDQMSMYKVKGVAHSDKLIENDHLTMQFP